MENNFDLLIIGAGQAGLAAAYYAQQNSLHYLVLEADTAVGNSWRKRYDSLVLFTPRWHNHLPGLDFEGDQDGYPTKDETADYLKKYAEHFHINIQFDQKVTKLSKEGSLFQIKTNSATYLSKAVIIAAGPFQTPSIPKWSKSIKGILQIHSSQYKNPSQIQGKDVLIIGGGNSGAQIAEELASKYKVSLSVNKKLRFMPTKMFGRSIFWWLTKLGLSDPSSGSLQAKILQKRGDPIMGTGLKRLLKSKAVALKPEAVDMKEDGSVVFKDGSTGRYNTIIFSTGFYVNYDFIHIPHALDDAGSPLHKEGKSTTVEGLYYLGLSWLRSRNSALLGGVSKDAEFIIQNIRKQIITHQ